MADGSRFNFYREKTLACPPLGIAAMMLSRDERKDQILKMDEYKRLPLGSECPKLNHYLTSHESQDVKWSDIDDGPIQTLKNWAAEMTGSRMTDLGANVNHWESLYYVVQEWDFQVSNQLLFVLAFDVYDQQFVLISFRQSDRAWVNFLTGS